MASKTATAVSELGFPWWIVLVEGIFALIFGVTLDGPGQLWLKNVQFQMEEEGF